MCVVCSVIEVSPYLPYTESDSEPKLSTWCRGLCLEVSSGFCDL